MSDLRAGSPIASVLLLVAAVGSVALYVPARRIARLDPVVALRME